MGRNYTHHWRKVPKRIRSAKVALCKPKCRDGTLHSAECHPGASHQIDQNRKFWPRERISLQTFTPIVSLQDFLHILSAPWPKITNRSFWPSCDQFLLLIGVRLKTVFGPFEVRPWVKFSKFWHGENSDLYVNGTESFPPGFFIHFGRQTAENW